MRPAPPLPPLAGWKAALCVGGAALCFNTAYLWPAGGVLIFGYVLGLVQLARLPTARLAFYAGLLAGLLCVAPQLFFFYTIFGPGALLLWTILALWTALFVALSHGVCRRLPAPWSWLLLPFLWTGLEYFRGEVYSLRFSWLNVGYALAGFIPAALLRLLGMYGVGFLAASLAACVLARAYKTTLVFAATVAAVWPFAMVFVGPPPLRVAGIQMEFPSTPQLLAGLDTLTATHPDAQLLVLSEYTCDGPVPDEVKRWCRDHARYLAIGGKDPAPGGDGAYYDTAFVIGPTGEIVFKQGKSVPIQFFNDGLPAPSQQVWDSPWGKLGFCICYDLSYRRVTDRLIRDGAQALIVPTMDVETWGRREHELHAHVARVRAAEYGVPIFRVASSGVSQAVDATGHEIARAPFPGPGATLSAALSLAPAGRVPLDAALGPLAVAVAVGCAGWLVFAVMRDRLSS